jgi:hypothetical protein
MTTTHCQSNVPATPLARQLLQETWLVHIQQVGIQKQEALFFMLGNAGLESKFQALTRMGIVNLQLLAYITAEQIAFLCPHSAPQRLALTHLRNQMWQLVQTQRRDILRVARTT